MCEKDKDVLLLVVLLIFAIVVLLVLFLPEKSCEERGGKQVQTGYIFIHDKGNMSLVPIYECEFIDD